MPRLAKKDSRNTTLNISPQAKRRIMRAAAISQTTLTDFMVKAAEKEAEEVIDKAQHVILSEEDTLRLLDRLENPPKPTQRMREAGSALPSLP